MDAVGGAIHHIATVHRYAREEDRPEKTMFIITTDGYENASKQYTYNKVKKMIQHEQKKYGWEFLFLGANIDAVAEAGKFGIQANRAVNYECDEEGTELNYRVLSKAVSSVRHASVCAGSACCSEPMIDDNWADEIKADYERRHGKR